MNQVTQREILRGNTTNSFFIGVIVSMAMHGIMDYIIHKQYTYLCISYTSKIGKSQVKLIPTIMTIPILMLT